MFTLAFMSSFTTPAIVIASVVALVVLLKGVASRFKLVPPNAAEDPMQVAFHYFKVMARDF